MRGLQSLLDHRTLAASDSRCAGRARGRRLKFRQYLTQRLHGNGAPVTDNAKPIDQIFKLSHISFPWVLTKKSHALLWYFNRRKGKLLGFFSNQSPYKQRDVVRPFAQRRDHQPQHIQTIKEIQPDFPSETAFCRLRCVAAMIRTSIGMIRSPPTRMICFS